MSYHILHQVSKYHMEHYNEYHTQWQLTLDKNHSLVPKADSKIVQLDLFGAAMVFFSFISYLQILFSLFIFPQTTWPACFYRLFSLVGLSILFQSGPNRIQVCLHMEQHIKQTNKQTKQTKTKQNEKKKKKKNEKNTNTIKHTLGDLYEYNLTAISRIKLNCDL